MVKPPTIEEARLAAGAPIEVRKCLRCGNCCKTLDLNLIPAAEVLDILEKHYNRGVDRIWIRAKHQCEQLIKDPKKPGKYKCKIYRKRPRICEEHVCDYMKGSDLGRFIQFVVGEDSII